MWCLPIPYFRLTNVCSIEPCQPQLRGFGIHHSLIWPSGFPHTTWQPQSAGSPPLLAHQEAQFGRRQPQVRGTTPLSCAYFKNSCASEMRGTTKSVICVKCNRSILFKFNPTVWILCEMKILPSWVLAWSACFQLLGQQSNKPTKKYCKYCECCEMPSPIGDNFLSASFHPYFFYSLNFFIHIVQQRRSWNPTCALSEWEFEELWEAGPGLVQPSLPFFSQYSQPQPQATCLLLQPLPPLVIYGNPCGMQDGNPIFIENYQTEDLGASIHRRSKPSLHLLDSFRLKSLEPTKPSRNSEKLFFPSYSKRPTGSDASAVETDILTLSFIRLWAGRRSNLSLTGICVHCLYELWTCNNCWYLTSFKCV